MLGFVLALVLSHPCGDCKPKVEPPVCVGPRVVQIIEQKIACSDEWVTVYGHAYFNLAGLVKINKDIKAIRLKHQDIKFRITCYAPRDESND